MSALIYKLELMLVNHSEHAEEKVYMRCGPRPQWFSADAAHQVRRVYIISLYPTIYTNLTIDLQLREGQGFSIAKD